MEFETIVNNAVYELTHDNDFYISHVKYDEDNFGNISIMLCSTNQIKLRFIKDRGNFWCELSMNDEWFYIEDIFQIIGIEFIDSSNDFIDFITKTSVSIKYNLQKIIKAFNHNNYKLTIKKIKLLQLNRAQNLF